MVVVVVVVNDWINMAQTQQRSGPRYKVNVTNAVIVMQKVLENRYVFNDVR